MSALIFITVLAAQAATQPAAPEPAVADASRKSHLGSSTFVDLEAGAGYSTNPNFEFGDNTGGGFGRLSVHGVHTRVSERTTTVLSAFAQDTFYTRRYGSQESLDLNAQHDARVSEKVRVFGDLDFAYDKGGQLDTRVLALPELPLPPGVIQPPILISPSDFLSVTGRHYIASGHVGTQLSLSSREFLSATTGVEHVVYKSGSFRTHYTTIPVSLGYDRQISTRTTVGARVSAQFTDYDGPTSVRVVTPELTVQTMLTERMSFVGSLGVSFSSVDDGIRTRHSTGLAGSGSLCSQGGNGSFLRPRVAQPAGDDCCRSGKDRQRRRRLFATPGRRSVDPVLADRQPLLGADVAGLEPDLLAFDLCAGSCRIYAAFRRPLVRRCECRRKTDFARRSGSEVGRLRLLVYPVSAG